MALEGKTFVLELGHVLGFLPFAQKNDIIKQITQQLGGRITSIVTPDVTAVISRDVVSAQEFDASLPLQAAVRYGIPAVKLSWVRACVALEKLVKPSQFLIKYPEGSNELRAIIKSQLGDTEWRDRVALNKQVFAKEQEERLIASCEQEEIAKTPAAKQGVFISPYDEAQSESEEGNNNNNDTAATTTTSAATILVPSFPAAPHYTVARQSLFVSASRQARKIELHVSDAARAASHPRLGQFRFRVVQYDVADLENSKKQQHKQQEVKATFALTSERAEVEFEKLIERTKKDFGGPEAERVFPLADGIGSQVAQSDLSSFYAMSSSSSSTGNNSLLSQNVKNLVETLFQDSWHLLRRRASAQLCDNAIGSGAGAASSSISLADVYKADAALARVSSVLVTALQRVPEQNVSLAEQSLTKEEIKVLEAASKDFFGVVKQQQQQQEEEEEDRKTTAPVIKTIDALQGWEDVTRALRGFLNVGESAAGNVLAAPPGVQYAALDCGISQVSPSADPEQYATILKLLNQQAAISSSAASAAADSPSRVDNFLHSNNISVSAIYQLRRAGEARRFVGNEVGNVKLLFHGTSAGCVASILQTGLEVPKVPRLRRDGGFLGRGVYFGDVSATAVKYAGESAVSSTATAASVFILVAEVALGSVWETGSHQIGLTEPPPNFHSVRGIASADGSTKFVDNEFVVYRSEQVRLAYLVELKKQTTRSSSSSLVLPPAPISTPPPLPPPPLPTATFHSSLVTGPASSITSERAAQEFVAPKLKEVKSGLQNTSSGVIVPLQKTRVKGTVLDLIGEFTIFQEYYNSESTAIEGKYVFPLQSGAAVCVFEAYINHKKVVGVVKEKEEARKEYKAAVAAGHGAYLMDESEETPDVFTISVGNLPPKCRVVIKIAYIIELSVNAATNAIEVRIPADVHPATADTELTTTTQSTTATRASASPASDVALEVGWSMPFDIVALECSHPNVRRKRTACCATISADAVDFKRNGDFVASLRMSTMTRPRIWVEEHFDDGRGAGRGRGGDGDGAAGVLSKATMITFFPETDSSLGCVSGAVQAAARREVLILLDGSASMKNSNALTDAKVGALLALKDLLRVGGGEEKQQQQQQQQWRFNVAIFGTKSYFAFPRSRPCSQAEIETASEWIQTRYAPCFGGTHLGGVLTELGELLAADDDGNNNKQQQHQRQLDVVLFTDGHLCNESILFNDLKSLKNLRVFPISVGDASSKTTLYSIARFGRGRSAVLSRETKNAWPAVIGKQIARCSQLALTDVNVEWTTEPNPTLRHNINASVIQSPNVIPSVFNNEHTIVYGNVVHQARQAELVARYTGVGVTRDQYGDWPEQRMIVTANTLSMISGQLIHRLAAKSRIRDWLEGCLQPALFDGSAALYSSSENETIKAATKQAIIDLGCRFGLVTPFTSMIAVEERTEEEKQMLLLANKKGDGGRTSCTTPPIDKLAEAVSADVIAEVSYAEEYDDGTTKKWDVLPPAAATTTTTPQQLPANNDNNNEVVDAIIGKRIDPFKDATTVPDSSQYEDVDDEEVSPELAEQVTAYLEQHARRELRKANFVDDLVRGYRRRKEPVSRIMSDLQKKYPPAQTSAAASAATQEAAAQQWDAASLLTTQQLMFRDKMKALLEKHQPSWVERIPDLLRKAQGREDELLEKLKQKFVVGPVASSSVPPSDDTAAEAAFPIAASIETTFNSKSRRFRERLEFFFYKYCPEKVGKINEYMTFSGKEEELMEALVSRYASSADASPQPTAAATTMPQQLGRTKERIIAFYQKYDPQKVEKADSLAEKYAGREVELFAALNQKYGVGEEQAPSSSGWAASTAVVAATAAAAAAAAAPTPTPVVVSSSSSSASASSTMERITALYKKYNPEKLEQAESLSRKYAGQEEHLLAALTKKYGPEPSSSEAAPSCTAAAAAAVARTPSSRPTGEDGVHVLSDFNGPAARNDKSAPAATLQGYFDNSIVSTNNVSNNNNNNNRSSGRASMLCDTRFEDLDVTTSITTTTTSTSTTAATEQRAISPVAKNTTTSWTPDGDAGGGGGSDAFLLGARKNRALRVHANKAIMPTSSTSPASSSLPQPSSSSSQQAMAFNGFAFTGGQQQQQQQPEKIAESMMMDYEDDDECNAPTLAPPKQDRPPPPPPPQPSRPRPTTMVAKTGKHGAAKTILYSALDDSMECFASSSEKRSHASVDDGDDDLLRRLNALRADDSEKKEDKKEKEKEEAAPKSKTKCVMSIPSAERIQQADEDRSRDRDSRESARATASRIANIQNAALESLKRTQATVEESKDVGSDAASVLRRQTEQMCAINARLDIAKEKKSFFGKFKAPSAPSASTSSTAAAAAAAAPMFDPGDDDAEIDRALDRISSGVSRLHAQASSINQELKVQNSLLCSAEERVDAAGPSSHRKRRSSNKRSEWQDYKDVAEISGEMAQLHEAYRDFNAVVQEQGESIDSVASNIADSKSSVERGVIELQAASHTRHLWAGRRGTGSTTNRPGAPSRLMLGMSDQISRRSQALMRGDIGNELASSSSEHIHRALTPGVARKVRGGAGFFFRHQQRYPPRWKSNQATATATSPS